MACIHNNHTHNFVFSVISHSCNQHLLLPWHPQSSLHTLSGYPTPKSCSENMVSSCLVYLVFSPWILTVVSSCRRRHQLATLLRAWVTGHWLNQPYHVFVSSSFLLFLTFTLQLLLDFFPYTYTYVFLTQLIQSYPIYSNNTRQPRLSSLMVVWLELQLSQFSHLLLRRWP